MPNYATYSDLESIIAKSHRSVTILEKSLANKSLFLSHSSKDRTLLPGVLSILEGHGASVYVDVLDDELPSPSPEMSQRLKDAVGSCRRFVLFVTPNSKQSIWIPWELGLADGSKGLSSVALFPASPTALEVKWSEREYLGLYRRIVWGTLRGESQPSWLVWDHTKNTASKLSTWCAH